MAFINLSNVVFTIFFLFNIFEFYRVYSCRPAELCVITNVFHCEPVINGVHNFRCHLAMICSDGAEFRDIADTDEIPYTNNYIYWDKESIIAQNIITRMFFINFAILYIYWQCC